ncbi:MAG: DUF502 domain-containing protein [Fusobacteria bacterium]|nr:DUF502 domain-containing protein [Fusobacteriota bacterium]
MKRVYNLIKSRILLGIGTLLPLVILLYIVKVVYTVFYDISFPIVDILGINSTFIHTLLAILIFVLLCLLLLILGVALKTSVGSEIIKFFEQLILLKIPGYSMLKDTVEKFKTSSNQKSIFSNPSLVDLYESDVLMGAFVTDESEKHYTVYVPVAPNITSGYIYHVEKEWVNLLENCSSSEMIKTMIGCGVGSSKILTKGCVNEKPI